MSIKRLRATQRGKSCDWCSLKATYRGFMFGKVACDNHLEELRAWDQRERREDHSDAAFYGRIA